MDVQLVAITPDAEEVIEDAARTCYQSGNKKDTGNSEGLIRRLVKSGHHSVLEHAYATFRLNGVSRAFTHQMVRHRLCAFSQQSQRYVDEEDFSYVVPSAIEDSKEALAEFENAIERTRKAYAKLQDLGIKNEDARFVLPNAVDSEIVVSANFRELRHIFAVRCQRRAQWEIREVALRMLHIMQEEAPSVFGDFEVDDAAGTAFTPFSA